MEGECSRSGPSGSQCLGTLPPVHPQGRGCTPNGGRGLARAGGWNRAGSSHCVLLPAPRIELEGETTQHRHRRPSYFYRAVARETVARPRVGRRHTIEKGGPTRAPQTRPSALSLCLPELGPRTDAGDGTLSLTSFLIQFLQGLRPRERGD